MSSTVFANVTMPVFCPACHGELRSTDAAIVCSACQARYPIEHGVPDLIVGDRYDDDTPDCALCNEEVTNRDTSLRYWIPLFERMFGARRDVRILSLGCGVGADVDALVEQGWDAYGLDNGKRSAHWAARRKRPERLFMANGKHMPFPSETFDIVFCGCVFPHVGVVGTTFNTTPDFWEQRSALAGEVARVLKRGGSMISCNPNRFFPFDIFHGHQAGKPVLRPTMPWERLLMSKGDYLRMFTQFGRFRATALSNENYWSFTNSKRSLKGRIMAAPVSALFTLVSRVGVLRGSPLNPWLVVRVEKGMAQ
jgi:SAM-dependent methyltransferase